MAFQRLTWKFLIAGSKGSGKSSLISALTYGDFSVTPTKPLLKRTITKEFNGKKLIIDVLFQETNGNYEKQVQSSTAILLVLDITEEKSYNFVKNILSDIIPERRGPIFIAANKLDLKYEAAVWIDDMEALKSEFGIEYFLVSCKDGQGINEMMDSIIERLASKLPVNKLNE